MVDFSPGGSDFNDLSGNGKGIDLNSDIADVDGEVVFVSNDNFTYIDLCGGFSVPFTGFIFLSSTHPSANGLFFVSAGSVVTCTPIWRSDTALLDVGTGAPLNGTTGTSGHLQVRAASNGRVYLENRLGVTIKVKMFAMNVMG